MSYRINNPKVIHETFETEVVIVNLESGNYYSVGGSGIEIWRRLRAGLMTPDIIAGLGVNGDSARITAFLDELEREQLIVRDETGAQSEKLEARAPGVPFVPPTLEKFTEMRDLLLLDPIHEMDEAGWPKAAPARPGEK